MPVATLVTPPSPALKLHDSLPPPLETSPMHQFRSIRRLALGAALAGAVVGLAPAAASANKQPTCTYNDGLRQVNVADKSDVFRLQLFVQGGQIAARNDIGSNTTTVHCFSLTGSGTDRDRLEHRPDRRVRHARGYRVRRLPRRLLHPGLERRLPDRRVRRRVRARLHEGSRRHLRDRDPLRGTAGHRRLRARARDHRDRSRGHGPGRRAGSGQLRLRRRHRHHAAVRRARRHGQGHGRQRLLDRARQ